VALKNESANYSFGIHPRAHARGPLLILIGGSIASSVYGMARSTLDVDLVADIKINNISSLKQNLEKDYYIDEHMISDAIERESYFNLIHLETMEKIDVFIHKN
jgi:hypothetical protein